MLIVNKIYPAFMGEVNCHGIGVPCTFVRLAGCNLRCYYKTKGILCDTPEALTKKGDVMVSTEVLRIVENFGNKIVCLTGGEPLLQDVKVLLERLTNNGYHVVIETNGSCSIEEYRSLRNVSFVVDYKSASSGEGDKMKKSNWKLLNEKDFVKFVIDDYDDYLEAKIWRGSHLDFKGNIAFGLFWGSKLDYQELMRLIIKDKLKGVYVNMQTHKMACLYDAHKGDLLGMRIPRDL